MFAAAACGLVEDIEQAKTAMGNGFGTVYEPNPDKIADYQRLYKRYKSFGNVIEQRIETYDQ